MPKLSHVSFIALAAASLLWVSTPQASASTITPGTSCAAPCDLFGAITGSVVADTGVLTITASSFSSTYEEQVIADSGRGGQLDFVLVSTNSGTSNDAIGRISLASFAGFTTDVGTATSAGTLVGGTIAPTSIDSSIFPAGKVIGFNFNSLIPGTTTQILVIETNALNWTSGTVAEQDSSNGQNIGFAPSAVPAPILGAGLPGLIIACGGLLALGRRRRQKMAVA